MDGRRRTLVASFLDCIQVASREKYGNAGEMHRGKAAKGRNSTESRDIAANPQLSPAFLLARSV
jgi:hypothetical protein